MAVRINFSNRFSKIIIIAITTVSLALGCAWDDEDTYFSHILDIEILSDAAKKWAPFLPEIPSFSPQAAQTDTLETMLAPSINDWAERYPDADKKSIGQLLSVSIDETVADPESIKKTLSTFSSWQHFSQNDKDYLTIAKLYENLCRVTYDGYTDDDNDPDEMTEADQVMLDMIEDCESRMETVQGDTFLTQRYLFQVVRAYHYTNRSSDALAIYDKYKGASMPQNSIYWRTRCIIAGALRKTGKSADAKAMFAVIFNCSPEQRILAYKNCKYIDSASFDDAAAKIDNKDDNAALRFIQLVYSGEITPDILQEIADNASDKSMVEVAALKILDRMEDNWYSSLSTQPVSFMEKKRVYFGECAWDVIAKSTQLTCDNKKLRLQENGAQKDSWITRLLKWFKKIIASLSGKKSDVSNEVSCPVNLLQNPVCIPWVDGTWQSLAESSPNPNDGNRLSKFISVCSVIANNKQTQNPAAFNLMRAYAALIGGKWDECDRACNDAAAIENNNPKIAAMIRYVRTLSKIERKDKITPTLEASVDSCMTGDLSHNNRSYQINTMMTRLAQRYLAEGRMTRAALSFMASGINKTPQCALLDFYMTVEDIDSLIAFSQKSGTSHFEDFLKAWCLHPDVLNEIAGSKLLRSGNFDGAVTRFEKCSRGYWHAQSFADENNGSYYGGHAAIKTSPDIGVDYQSYDVNRYIKLEFAREAQRLNRNKTFESYIQLGNLFYHDVFWIYTGTLWGSSSLLDAVRYVEAGNYPFNISDNTSFLTEFTNRKSVFVSGYACQQMAAYFYFKAIAAATSEGDKARAMFALGSALSANWTSYGDVAATMDKNMFFKEFMSLYAHDPYFQQAAAQCTELRDFMNR
ncbi:MAG: hypothetical protein ACM31E_08865 [Fibrobacterota bacterium]